MEPARVKEAPFLVIEHRYPVAPNKIWRAWTDPQALKRWFAPGAGESVSLAELDLRVGGRYRIVFGGADGTAHEVQGFYQEIVPNRRLVFTWTWPRTTPERVSLVSITLTQVGTGTELVFRHEQFFDEAARDRHRHGWSLLLDNLERDLLQAHGSGAGALPRTEPFVVERIFDAPRPRVWRAWTDAAELERWWGPKGFRVHTCKLDLQVGGVFHYGMTSPDGHDMWGRFTYREIAPPERLVFVVAFSDPAGGITRHPMNANWPRETLSTVTFEEQGDRTKLTVRWTPVESSTELERKTFDEGRAGMKQGWSGTFEQFAAYLAAG